MNGFKATWQDLSFKVSNVQPFGSTEPGFGMGPRMVELLPDGRTYSGLYQLYTPSAYGHQRVIYLLDGTPAYLDGREFPWQASWAESLFTQHGQYDGHGRYITEALFLREMGSYTRTFEVIEPRLDAGMFILTETRFNPSDRRQREKHYPTRVTFRQIRPLVERRIINEHAIDVLSLRVAMRIEGAGTFNLKKKLLETDLISPAMHRISSAFFADDKAFFDYIRASMVPADFELVSAQLTCRYTTTLEYGKAASSVTHRWGEGEVFEPGPVDKGELRFSLADPSGTMMLHMRVNTITGECSTHYFSGVGALSMDRMSVVDFEFTLRDSRQTGKPSWDEVTREASAAQEYTEGKVTPALVRQIMTGSLPGRDEHDVVGSLKVPHAHHQGKRADSADSQDQSH